MVYNLKLAIVSFLSCLAKRKVNKNTGIPMTKQQVILCTRLKGLGFAQGNQMKLYGEKFEVVSEPIVMGDNLVLLDAIETKSGRLKRVRIPLPILKMANGERSAA